MNTKKAITEREIETIIEEPQIQEEIEKMDYKIMEIYEQTLTDIVENPRLTAKGMRLRAKHALEEMERELTMFINKVIKRLKETSGEATVIKRTPDVDAFISGKLLPFPTEHTHRASVSDGV
jgi:undecaprenyl pyrophosphate synthase